MKFLFVRHGETDWNVKKKIQGSTDIPLNENGIRQAQELAKELVEQNVKAARIYTSPQVRAAKTAEIIGQALQVECFVEDGLREMDLGLWEGRNWDEIQREDKATFLYWNAHRRYTRTPQGESYNDVLGRTLEALADIMRREAEDVVVVSHSAVIMALLCYLAGAPFEEEIMIARYKLNNVEIAEVESEKIQLAIERFKKE